MVGTFSPWRARRRPGANIIMFLPAWAMLLPCGANICWIMDVGPATEIDKRVPDGRSASRRAVRCSSRPIRGPNDRRAWTLYGATR